MSQKYSMWIWVLSGIGSLVAFVTWIGALIRDNPFEPMIATVMTIFAVVFILSGIMRDSAGGAR